MGKEIVKVRSLFEILPAKLKKFRETVVFVHHYGGNRGSSRKHVEWLNDLGYDCVTFDLPMRDISDWSELPISKNWRFGTRHIWADKIENVLSHIPHEKIIFSFSYASAAALDAITRRNAIDIKAWVCDGGPFKHLEVGFHNLIKNEMFINKPWRLLRSKFFKETMKKPLGSFFTWLSGGNNYDKEVDNMLSRLPKKFPIFSVRYESDRLISLNMIEDFFKFHLNHISLEIYQLKNAAHLLGIFEEPDEYKSRIQIFLQKNSKTLH